jgi:mono/diheme cytochrome c family protein
MCLASAKTVRTGQSAALRPWILLAGSALFALAVPGAHAQKPTPPAEKSQDAPSGNAESGKKIYTKYGCYECHGREGQGAAQASGPRIGPPQRLIRSFIKYVRQPTGQMPPFTEEVISDQELTDIYAFLESRPRAASPKDIPLLNQ